MLVGVSELNGCSRWFYPRGFFKEGYTWGTHARKMYCDIWRNHHRLQLWFRSASVVRLPGVAPPQIVKFTRTSMSSFVFTVAIVPLPECICYFSLSLFYREPWQGGGVQVRCCRHIWVQSVDCPRLCWYRVWDQQQNLVLLQCCNSTQLFRTNTEVNLVYCFASATYSICMRPVVIIYTSKYYGAMAIKSWRVIGWW